MKSDLQLRRDVLDELEWEPSIDSAGIGVSAHDGVVTLTGRVQTYAEKLTAERAAERVSGVNAIANDIEVQFGRAHERGDTDIAEAAANSLRWKTLVPEGQITASVTKGWITLEGEVDWQYQKDAAFDAVRFLMGVHGVTNLIGLKPRASATEVKSRIEAAFRRSAELDAKNIEVEARDGTVTLRGKVHSWSERQEAVRTASAAPGVTKVENLISIAF